MTPPNGQLATEDTELWALAGNMCDGTITDRDREHLESILLHDEQARLFFVAYMDLHGRMMWRYRGGTDEIGLEDALKASDDALSFHSSTTPAIAPTMQVQLSPFCGWPAAYLIATVIFAIGAVIGSFTYVSHPVELVRGQGLSDSHSLESVVRGWGSGASGKQDAVVGRITGMADCVLEEKGLGGKKGLGIRDWGLEEGSRYKVQGSKEVASGRKRTDLNHPSRKRLATGYLVCLGDTFALASGLMEITYETGAKVILQGPVAYEVDSADGGFLAKGKLTARVEKRGEGREERGEGEEGSRFKVQGSKEVASGEWRVASQNHQSTINNQQSSNPQSLIPNPSLPTPHYPLFTIKTPTATVTDLGTEFGVEVDAEGQDRVYVFEGKVVLQATGKDSSNSVVLEAGHGSLVDSLGVITRQTCEKAAMSSASFVRKIPQPSVKVAKPSRVSLADMIAGGKGLTERSGWGIDPRDAHIVVQYVADMLDSSGRYERFSGIPQIDGVFIPNGETQVDSAEHVFALPTTSGTTCGPIWVSQGTEWMGPPANPKLVVRLHANAGITFNLTAIQNATRKRLVRFESSVAYRPQFEHFDRSFGADVWVLIDGQLRFSRSNLRDNDGLIPIDIPLKENDRFMTLISTEGNDNNFGDHIQFLDPCILLENHAN